jgi:Holliday junction resolvasome RuvABC endonuclease subunit
MVRDMLDLPTIPRPDDAADALAFALTHVQFLQGGGAPEDDVEDDLSMELTP